MSQKLQNRFQWTALITLLRASLKHSKLPSAYRGIRSMTLDMFMFRSRNYRIPKLLWDAVSNNSFRAKQKSKIKRGTIAFPASTSHKLLLADPFEAQGIVPKGP